MKKIASFLALILFSAMSFAASIGAPTKIDFGTYNIYGETSLMDSLEISLSPSGISDYGIGVEVINDANDIFWTSDSWLYANGTPDWHGVKKAKVYFYADKTGTFTATLRLSDYDSDYDEATGIYANHEDVQLKVIVVNNMPRVISYERVESALAANDTVIFVNEAAGAVSGPLSGTYLTAVTTGVKINTSTHTAEVPEEGVQAFVVSKYSGNYQFTTVDTQKRMHLDISGKGAFTFDETSSTILANWGVTITSGVAEMYRPSDETFPVYFNSDRFKPYKNPDGTCKSFSFYKKVSAPVVITSKLEVETIDLGTVELSEEKEVTVNYTGENLTDDIMWDITGTDAALFIVTPDVSTNRTSGSVTVKYLGTASAVKTVDAKLYALTQDANLDDLEKEIPISITLAASTIKLTKIEFVNAPDSLVKGKSIDLKPYLVFTPSNAADKSLTWTVDKSYQGTVEDGVYTAKNVTGNVTITATSVKVPSVSASVTLMQYEPKPKTVTLNKHELTTYIGVNDTLQATVSPVGASQKCWYTSRNTNIITCKKGNVDGAGVLTVKALCPEGVWVIVNPGSSATEYPNIKDSCLVKVVPVSVESVAFDPDTKEMTVGAIYQLVPVVTPAAAATQYTATYESNNTAVATVSETGLVTAKAEGTAKITCTLGGKSGQITINVVGAKYFTKVTDASKMQAGDTIILVANVGENPLVAGQVNSAKNCLDTILGGIITADNSVACDRALTLVVGGTTDNFTLTKLGTTSTLATSDNTKLGYSTSKNKWKFVAGAAGVMLTNASYNEKNICYNSQSKYIRMYAVGTTSTPLYVYVRPYAAPILPDPTAVELDQTSYDTHVGDPDVTLKATVKPSGASQEVIWESSNTAVATVNASGKVHPVSAGTAVITAKVKSNESLKAECTVNVLAWTVEYVEFDITGDLNLEVGEQETVTATAYPTGHGFKVDYYTSNENIATVTIGGVVTGVAVGDVTITAKSGDKEAKLNVHVTAAPVPEEKGDISVADFLAAKDGFNIYTLTGWVSNIKEDSDGVPYKRGEFTLNDATGSIAIYGILTPDGVADKFWDMDIDEKDTVTLKGSYDEYKGTPQIKNATLVEVKKYVEPVDPTAIEAVSIKGRATKVLREGQIIIIREEKEFDVVGRQLK